MYLPHIQAYIKCNINNQTKMTSMSHDVVADDIK